MPDTLRVQVQHRFGTSKAQDTFSLDATFTIDRWPAVLFGPSGAGKTVLLRAIAGLDPASTSNIFLGERALNPGRTDSAVQLVAQRPALFPHLNVAQNVSFGLAHRNRLDRQAHVQEMLALLGAEHLAGRMPTRLSGGERQRVAIARAIAPGPKLLLLDEAFAGLDSTAKQEILAQLTLLLRERDIAALYVTHEVEDAFALDAEVIVLDAGRVIAQGPVQQALASQREQLLTTLGIRT